MDHADTTRLPAGSDEDALWTDPFWRSIERVRILLRENRRYYFRDINWEHGLNVAQINQLAAELNLGPVFREREESDPERVVARYLDVMYPGPRDPVAHQRWHAYSPSPIPEAVFERTDLYLRAWQEVRERQLGIGDGRAPLAHTMRRTGKSWSVTFGGSAVVLLRDLAGFGDIARLLKAAGAPIRAQDLLGPTTGGSLGAVMDKQALHDAELAATAARDRGDLEQAEEIECEIQKQRGLGGRAREKSNPRKKARDAVRRRLRTAMEELERSMPAFHQYLKDRLTANDPYRIEIRDGDPPWFVIW
jgi:hypothetical protein